MRKIAILVAFILPVFLRDKFLKLFALSLGKGFDLGSTEKEFNLIKPHLNHNPKLLIDVGVNQGNYSDILVKNYPDALIYLFEPQKYLYDILLKKYSLFNKISLFNLALDENKGEVTLVKGFEGDGLASIYKRRYLKNKKELEEKVICNRLDNIIFDQKIDFIKIDVEGNEMRVLYGMEKIIRNIKVLQIEFGGTWIDSRFFYRDLYDYLKKYNFDLYRMSPNKLIKINIYEEIDEYFSFTNFVAINNLEI
jgi:FkbM family methyltransferase